MISTKTVVRGLYHAIATTVHLAEDTLLVKLLMKTADLLRRAYTDHAT